jgi:hypothetical protein
MKELQDNRKTLPNYSKAIQKAYLGKGFEITFPTISYYIAYQVASKLPEFRNFYHLNAYIEEGLFDEEGIIEDIELLKLQTTWDEEPYKKVIWNELKKFGIMGKDYVLAKAIPDTKYKIEAEYFEYYKQFDLGYKEAIRQEEKRALKYGIKVKE